MSGQLSMFGPMTSEDLPNAISSPESASGATPCDSPDGQMKEKSGPARAPASHSARPAKAKRSTTKGIFGQSGFHSSKHEDLSFALGNKLRPLTDSLGSTLFSLTWMTRITPAGRSISALRASEPLTEGSVFIGWPTPNTPSGGPNSKSTATHTGGMDLDGAATLAGWATLASWPITRAIDGEKGQRTEAGLAAEIARKGHLDELPSIAQLAGWKTPCVPNGGRISGNTEDLGKHRDGTKAQIGLENKAKLSGWTTPRPTDENMAIDAQLTAFGDGPIGFLLGPNGWEIVPASGQLNAAHSRWLMGLPPAWDDCGVTAMASSSKRPKASLKRTGA